MTKRYQGARTEKIQAEAVKTGLSGFGYRSIRIFQNR
jgi:hypothetical protein